MTAGAARWSCARCRVSVGQIDRSPIDLPTTWTRSGEQAFCLACSRALAGEAAIDCAPDSCSREELARLRRDAVVEFELGRTPEAPNRVVAQACRTSLSVVTTVRSGLSHAGS